MSGNWFEVGEAALQAVLGDYLDERRSGLATEMALYHRGRPLEALPSGTPKLCVLVHGMADTEACWTFPDQQELDYGGLLEREHGLTPLYVRYNTGLPIADNGQKLAALLQSVVTSSPLPVAEITLIGHSLGGLVIRSACHHDKDAAWLALVKRAFYLGSPHLGSPLEKAGRVVSGVLQAIDDPVVQLLGELAEVRSAAVKSMRHGALLESGEPVLLDERIDHYLVAGALPGPLASVLGDGLVRVPSATGAPGSEENRQVQLFPGLHHRALARDRDVYAWISSRCGPPNPTTPTEPRVGADPAVRLDAYFALLQDAVDKSSTAVQTVHEALAARPYSVLEEIPPLKAASRAVRSVHFGLMRGTYATVRLVNDLLRGLSSRHPDADRERHGHIA